MNRILVFFLTCTSCCINGFSMINEIKSFKEVENYFNQQPDKTLGVFDIDETLLITKNPAYRRKSFSPYRQAIKDLTSGLSDDQKMVLLNLMLIRGGHVLIEKETPVILGRIQEQGVKMIALTAAMTGKLEEVLLEERRWLDLKQEEIDFSKSFPHHSQLVFENLKPLNGSYPMFYKGILLTCGDFTKNKSFNSKADLLLEFFQQVKWMPTRVVFVDDKREHLEWMESILTKKYPEIAFVGLHYLGAEALPNISISKEECMNDWLELVETICN